MFIRNRMFLFEPRGPAILSSEGDAVSWQQERHCCRQRSSTMCLAVLPQYWNVTDRQT